MMCQPYGVTPSSIYPEFAFLKTTISAQYVILIAALSESTVHSNWKLTSSRCKIIEVARKHNISISSLRPDGPRADILRCLTHH